MTKRSAVPIYTATVGAVLLLSGQASAQGDTIDIEKPLEIRARAPLCHEVRSLDDAVMLAMQGEFQMAAEVEGCFALRRPTRVFIMEKRGREPVLYLRVRWRMSNGQQMDAWTMPYFLKNVEAPAEAPQPRRRL